MSTADVFKAYVGSIIKNPLRMTSDCDPVADEIMDLATKNGLILAFHKANTPAQLFPGTVTAHIAKEDAYGSRWRITEFTVS